MGDFVPKAVRSYGHKPESNDGKFQPNTLGPGMETVDKRGGGKAPMSGSTGTRPKSSVPKGVVRGDGTESRGSKPRTITSKPAHTAKSGSTHWPGDVKKHSGLKAPKQAR